MVDVNHWPGQAPDSCLARLRHACESIVYGPALACTPLGADVPKEKIV
jgi:hypothetical protein